MLQNEPTNTSKVSAAEMIRMQTSLPQESCWKIYAHDFNSNSHLTPLFNLSCMVKVRNEYDSHSAFTRIELKEHTRCYVLYCSMHIDTQYDIYCLVPCKLDTMPRTG